MQLINRWALSRTENDNFYYDLSPMNRSYLVSLVAAITGKSPSVIQGYVSELAADHELRGHIEASWSNDPDMADARVAFGRREGWFAFIRALKPRVVVETGVHHGVGACVIASALIRNGAEGAPGRYYGTDIDPYAGVLLSGRYAEVGQILYGDSITSLEALDATVEVFINDSDHSGTYEAREYEVIQPKMARRSLILGDNSHVTPALHDFARAMRRPFIFFAEDPLNHWYPGAGIGISPSAMPIEPV